MNRRDLEPLTVQFGWVLGGKHVWHRLDNGRALCGASAELWRMHELGDGPEPKCEECLAIYTGMKMDWERSQRR